MGNAFRRQPGPTLYGELKTPVTADMHQVGLIVGFVIIGFSFLLIIPGIRGWERLWATIRVSVALWIGAVLLLSNFGSWQSDKVCSRTHYKAHIRSQPGNIGYTKDGVAVHKRNTQRMMIQAEIGLIISLRGINITLLETGCFEDSTIKYANNRPLPNETINYNEQFTWSEPWGQGRLDFGKYGGKFNQEYRAAKWRGLPYPIMWIAEYFTLDDGMMMWCRKCRLAGWYTHILLWTSFATYLLSIILFIWNIWYGALYMLITGALMVLSAVTYCLVSANHPPLSIHFMDATLKPQLSWAFHLTLYTGISTVLGALVVLIIEWGWPRKTTAFFHHSLTQDDTMFEIEEYDEEFLAKFGMIGPGNGGHSSRRSTRNFHVRRRRTSEPDSVRRHPIQRRSSRRNVASRESVRDSTRNPRLAIVTEQRQEIQLQEIVIGDDNQQA